MRKENNQEEVELSASPGRTRVFDFIISGAGCAGLSLAIHMIQSGKFRDRKILLIDQDAKKSNDRTWCFWQNKKTVFDPVVYRQWEKLLFQGEDFSKALDIAPYQYKMIRGIDFYQHCFDQINQQPNFTFRQKKIDHVFSDENGTGIVAGNETILAQYVFNSILFEKPKLTDKQYWMLQHFKGWIIETDDDRFDVVVATLMDFRTDQKTGTAFFYVLPLSSKQALVEYTLFSEALLDKDEYRQSLQSYIRDILKIGTYKIIDEEFGIIPMTNYKFQARNNKIINIGTAGGQSKGSSGYTFNFIQKHSEEIVRQLIETGRPFLKSTGKRFYFYDSVLLAILKKEKLPGKRIFTDLFSKNSPQRVFKFLDNETSLKEELKIISSFPVMPFMQEGALQCMPQWRQQHGNSGTEGLVQ